MNKESTTSRVFGLASTSQRRRAALEQLPDMHIAVVPGGEEAKIDDLVTIALAKIAFAYPTILTTAQENNADLVGVTAADTQTLLQQYGASKQEKILVSRGKPEVIEQIRAHFVGMSNVAQNQGFGYYEVASASAVQDSRGTLAETSLSQFHLNAQKLLWLTTEEGFAAYIETFNQFYKSKAYSGNKLQPIAPTDISAGISLPVLTQMGVIEAINGVKLADMSSPEAVVAFKKALFNVGVGFSEQVLTRIHSEAMQYILKWAWLEEVTEHVMHNRA